jgi:hypothetical protein
VGCLKGTVAKALATDSEADEPEATGFAALAKGPSAAWRIEGSSIEMAMALKRALAFNPRITCCNMGLPATGSRHLWVTAKALDSGSSGPRPAAKTSASQDLKTRLLDKIFLVHAIGLIGFGTQSFDEAAHRHVVFKDPGEFALQSTARAVKLINSIDDSHHQKRAGR